MPISTHTQFHQMEIGKVGDAHPPIMATSFQFCRWAYFRMTGEQTTGQSLLYVAWAFLLWGGVLLMLLSNQPFWKNRENSQKPYWIVGVLLFLLLWSMLDLSDEPRIIMKDTGMLAAYLFAVGCLMNIPSKGLFRWCIALVVLFFLFYGTALRHNAIFALIPLLCWFVWNLSTRKKCIPVLACAFILWGGMLMAIQFVNYNVIGAIRLYTLQERFYADIFHLNARTSHFVLPPNSFGNDFSGLDETVFRALFNSKKLYIESAFERLKEEFPQKKWMFGPDVIVIRADNEDGAVEYVSNFDGNTKWEHRVLNEEFVREQYPKDYLTLRSAWIDRILQDPVTFVKFKTVFFIKYCRECSLYFLGLNPLFLLPLISLLALSPVWTRDLFKQATFPGVMLAWSALLYILPLWMFLPDGTAAGGFRYLFWFFAASIIAITCFCSQSPLFHEIIQTIHRYLEKKA